MLRKDLFRKHLETYLIFVQRSLTLNFFQISQYYHRQKLKKPEQTMLKLPYLNFEQA